MKIVIFSDIHGNYLALQQMLDDIEHKEIEAYFFSGDIWGYFWGQERCIVLMKQIPNLYAVKGNHDVRYLAAYKQLAYKKKMVSKYGSSYLQDCSIENLNWLQAIPNKLEVTLNDRRICMVHGSLEDDLNGRIYPDYPEEVIGILPYDVVILGHTHYQLYREEDEKCVINPGSLGQPRDGKGFSYVIYDLEKRQCEFKTVHIDTKQLQSWIDIETHSERNKQYLLKKIMERE